MYLNANTLKDSNTITDTFKYKTIYIQIHWKVFQILFQIFFKYFSFSGYITVYVKMQSYIETSSLQA